MNGAGHPGKDCDYTSRACEIHIEQRKILMAGIDHSRFQPKEGICIRSRNINIPSKHTRRNKPDECTAKRFKIHASLGAKNPPPSWQAPHPSWRGHHLDPRMPCRACGMGREMHLSHPFPASSVFQIQLCPSYSNLSVGGHLQGRSCLQEP